tara:strand:- start:28 stop:492 length:465 start_codon:yes stop_codon:yes gene_type:complete
MPRKKNHNKNDPRLKALISETDKLTDLMNNNIEKAYNTMDDIEDTRIKSRKLLIGAKKFNKQAKKSACRQCCLRWKSKLIWINIALLVLTIILMCVVKFVGICQDEFEPCPVMENPEFYLVAVMGSSLIFLSVLIFVNLKHCCRCFETCHTCCD